MAWALRRVAPSRIYWREVQQLDDQLLDGARQRGVSRRRVFPFVLAEQRTEKAALQRGLPRVVWKHGNMQIRLLGGMTLKTADSSLALPATLVRESYQAEGLSAPNARRVLSYEYAAPLGHLQRELHAQYAEHGVSTLPRDYDVLLEQLTIINDSLRPGDQRPPSAQQ